MACLLFRSSRRRKRRSCVCVCVLLRTHVATISLIFTVWRDEEGEVTEKNWSTAHVYIPSKKRENEWKGSNKVQYEERDKKGRIEVQRGKKVDGRQSWILPRASTRVSVIVRLSAYIIGCLWMWSLCVCSTNGFIWLLCATPCSALLSFLRMESLTDWLTDWPTDLVTV